MSLEYTVNKLLQVCVLIIFFFVPVSLAQGTGTIKGTISDKISGEKLPGANVIVQGTSLGAAADLDGEFVIRFVPAGPQKIVVTYIGYESSSFDLNVQANLTLEQDFELSATAVEGETVVVTAQAQGQLEAINQQLTSDKIANIVSEARIQELPDFNAASSLSRLPGISTTKSSGEDNKVVIRGLAPKYNSIEVEGVKLSATGSSDIGLTSDEFVYVKGENKINNDRSVDLTMISPYMIRTIAVYKSLTPDMNANSIGGTVNMELREAPTQLHYDLLWQQGYTAKSNTYGNYRAVGSASNRFFDENLGVYALFNIESYDRNSDNLEGRWDEAAEGVAIDPTTGYRPVKVTSVRFNRHLETRERLGGNLILDYNIPNGSIKVVNLLARINSNYTEHTQTINYNNGRLEWRLQEGENVTDQRLHSFKLDYDLGFLTADLSASYTSAANKLEDSPVLIFNQVGGVLIQDRDNVVPEQLSYLVNYNGVDNVVLRSGNLFSNKYKEDKYTYKADFQLPFNFGTNLGGFFQFGGQYINQSNSTDQETPYLSFDGSALPTSSDNISNNLARALQSQYGLAYNSAGQFTGASFLSSESDLFDSFLDNKYGDIYYATNPTFLADMLKSISRNPAFSATDPSLSNGRQGGWYNGPYQRFANDYNFDENYYAAYAMSRINFLDFMVIGGVRYEKVKSDYFAYNAIDQRNAQIQKMYDTTSVNENEFVLPMVQIKYTPVSWVDIRYAYTQTLTRPDYQALSPKFTITQATDIYAGNPELTPGKSFNHDVNITFHNNEIGLLTVGGFYKTIVDFVYQAEYRLDAAQNAGIDNSKRYTVVDNGQVVVSPVQLTGTVYRPLNNIYDAIVKGIELDFQHSFWYLPAPFNNIVFGINYARIYSETRYPFYSIEVIPGTRPPQFTLIEGSFSGRLIDQPNHVLNSYLGYDYEGFSARLSIVYQDNAARDNGGEFQENDSYTKSYTRLDFSARQKLPWFNSEVFLDVTNLNDERTSWVQKSIGGYMGIQNYGLTANLGVRVRY